MSSLPRLLTPREVAEALQISETKVRRNAKDWGGFQIGRQWRFPPNTLDRLIPTDATIPRCNASPESPSTAARGEAETTGQYDGAKTAPNANTAHTQRATKPKTQHTKSGNSFANDFPEYAHLARH